MKGTEPPDPTLLANVSKRGEAVDPTIVVSAVAAIAGGGGTLVGLVLREHRLRRRDREKSRGDHVRHLPPGSRVIDFGGRGMVIDIADPAQSGRGERLDDPR
ncbi:hypothetical protein HUT17_04850 (plasmid) [Nocardiopsis flavescens]|nr:hypothetical protein HUT17_04850 [Nocardiopsis flavescens]